MRGINIWKWLPLSYSSNLQLKNKRKEVILKNKNITLTGNWRNFIGIILWWSSGLVSALPLPGAWVWSLVRELKSHKPHGAKNKQTNPKTILGDIKQDFFPCLTGWPLIILHESGSWFGVSRKFRNKRCWSRGLWNAPGKGWIVIPWIFMSLLTPDSKIPSRHKSPLQFHNCPHRSTIKNLCQWWIMEE